MEGSENQAKVQDSSQQQTSQQNVAESGPPSADDKSKKKWIIIAIVIIVVLAIGGFLILRTPDFGGEGEPSPTPELEVVPTPVSTQTPEPDIDKGEISILILNGTGIAGEAGLLQTQLEDLGYTVIEVDNADSTDNEVTLVVFASNIPQSLQEEMIEELGDMYQEINSTTSSQLNDNEIEITTGLRSGQTPKATATPTATPDEDETTPTPTETASPTPTPTSTD